MNQNNRKLFQLSTFVTLFETMHLFFKTKEKQINSPNNDTAFLVISQDTNLRGSSQHSCP